MTTTTITTTPRAVKVSVLGWAPPIVQGLVRDLRVRWALEEAGWPYRENVLNQADQASAKYRELQPFGQVPAMQCDGLELFESGAIVHHIAERSPALMPEDPAARSQVTAWMFGALNSIEPPVMMLNVLDMIYQGPKGDDYNGLRAWVAGWVESRLDILSRVCSKARSTCSVASALRTCCSRPCCASCATQISSRSAPCSTHISAAVRPGQRFKER